MYTVQCCGRVGEILLSTHISLRFGMSEVLPVRVVDEVYDNDANYNRCSPGGQ